jgi:hypothetical protein
VALLASPAWAEDIHPPPWDASLPFQSSQAWECTEQFPIAEEYEPPITLDGVEPWETDNMFPGGPPTMTITNCDGIEEFPEGPTGQPTTAWHIGPGGGTVTLTIPNNPDENLYKLIFWQMTADKSATPTGDPPSAGPGDVSHPPSGIPSTQHPYSGDDGPWYTYNGLIKLSPNPEKETVTWDLAECTSITEIVVKTVCMPEPATLALVAAGAGLAVLRRRRRRGR